MNLSCPTCGAEVSFRFDDSLVRVCASCKSAVVRTDRGAETLGRFADPVNLDSSLRLFSDGWWGQQSFILIGNAQLRHAAGGVWQEWYAKLGAGVWGWLTEAQGRLYMTFERSEIPAPRYDDMYPNASLTLDGRIFTVSERSTAQYVSAMGEIPFRLVPQSSYHFVDLSDGRGGFATIDYNDGSESPTVYLGQQVSLEQLKITGGEAAPQTSSARQGGALNCPDCGGALELRTPDSTLSIGCPYCGGLIDVSHGKLAILGQQKKKEIAFDIPLGSEGTFPDGKLTVIGYVARSALIDGSWYPFEEYLLHSPTVGYRWLVSSDKHWNYVQPVAAGAVEHGNVTKYEGVKFTPYQDAVLRVDYVVGEFYWRVEIGERVDAEDFIAPPAMLSREYSTDEQNWSLSTYMTPSEVKKAFGTKLLLGTPTGIAPNQPYPGGIGKVIGFFTVALLAAGVVKCSTSDETRKYVESFNIPAGSAAPPVVTPVSDPTAPPSSPAGPKAGAAAGSAEPSGHIRFSKTIKLDDHNVEIHTAADLRNNWAFLSIDLVNEKTGALISFSKSLEYYSGIEGGESWSEGSSTDYQTLAPPGAGDYMLRIESQQGGKSPIPATIEVRQNVFRGRWLLVALGILFIPYSIVLWHAHSFHKRRMENSNAG